MNARGIAYPTVQLPGDRQRDNHHERPSVSSGTCVRGRQENDDEQEHPIDASIMENRVRWFPVTGRHNENDTDQIHHGTTTAPMRPMSVSGARVRAQLVSSSLVIIHGSNSVCAR